MNSAQVQALAPPLLTPPPSGNDGKEELLFVVGVWRGRAVGGGRRAEGACTNQTRFGRSNPFSPRLGREKKGFSEILSRFDAVLYTRQRTSVVGDILRRQKEKNLSFDAEQIRIPDANEIPSLFLSEAILKRREMELRVHKRGGERTEGFNLRRIPR